MTDRAEVTETPPTVSERRKNFEHVFYGLILFAVILSFFIQPLFKYLNPLLLCVLGVLIGSMIFSLYRHIVISAPGSSDKIISVFAALTAIGIVMTSFDGYNTYARSENECSKLQINIENKEPNYEKDAAAFSAFSCRYKSHPEIFINHDDLSKKFILLKLN